MYFGWGIAFDFIDAHANTLSGIVLGSPGIGVLGVWLGMLIALIGSVIMLRSDGHSEGYIGD